MTFPCSLFVVTGAAVMTLMGVNEPPDPGMELADTNVYGYSQDESIDIQAIQERVRSSVPLESAQVPSQQGAPAEVPVVGAVGVEGAGIEPGCEQSELVMVPAVRMGGLCSPPAETNPDDPDGEGPTPAQLHAALRQQIQSLPIDSGGITVQPERPTVLINIETIAYTSATAHTLNTTVLNVPVQVHLQPTTFTWDFGDGTPPLSTTDPGAPWPHHTVAHTYTHTTTTHITLTTTWQATYRITGTTTWHPITATPTTTTTSHTFDTTTTQPLLTS